MALGGVLERSGFSPEHEGSDRFVVPVTVEHARPETDEAPNDREVSDSEKTLISLTERVRGVATTALERVYSVYTNEHSRNLKMIDSELRGELYQKEDDQLWLAQLEGELEQGVWIPEQIKKEMVTWQERIDGRQAIIEQLLEQRSTLHPENTKQ